MNDKAKTIILSILLIASIGLLWVANMLSNRVPIGG